MIDAGEVKRGWLVHRDGSFGQFWIAYLEMQLVTVRSALETETDARTILKLQGKVAFIRQLLSLFKANAPEDVVNQVKKFQQDNLYA